MITPPPPHTHQRYTDTDVHKLGQVWHRLVHELNNMPTVFYGPPLGPSPLKDWLNTATITYSALRKVCVCVAYTLITIVVNLITLEHAQALLGGGGAQEWPDNLHLLSLKANEYEDSLTLRLEHLYESGEDPLLSKPIPVDLSSLFVSPAAVAAQRRSLSTVWEYEQMGSTRWQWRTSEPRSPQPQQQQPSATATGGSEQEAHRQQKAGRRTVLMLQAKEIQTYTIKFQHP